MKSISSFLFLFTSKYKTNNNRTNKTEEVFTIFSFFFCNSNKTRTAKTSIYVVNILCYHHIYFSRQDLHNNSTLSIENIRNPILNFNPIRLKNKKLTKEKFVA